TPQPRTLRPSDPAPLPHLRRFRDCPANRLRLQGDNAHSDAATALCGGTSGRRALTRMEGPDRPNEEDVSSPAIIAILRDWNRQNRKPKQPKLRPNPSPLGQHAA